MVRGSCLFVPIGKSVIVPPNGCLTVKIPLETAETLQAIDSGRLPGGISASSGIWVPRTNLKVLLHNSTAQPKILGSKTAAVGVSIGAVRAAEIQLASAQVKPIRCV